MLNQDVNWQKLKAEKKRTLFEQSLKIKTQSPLLLDFGKFQSFKYRRWDGCAWHTELRNLDSDKPSLLTDIQHQFKDNLKTLFALKHTPIKMKWITPIDKSQQCDPTYQLILFNGEWHCLIENSIFAASRTAIKKNKTYTETGFSQKNEPVITFEESEQAIDRILGKTK